MIGRYAAGKARPRDMVLRRTQPWPVRPRREFSTLYLAESARTALREVLAPLAPVGERVVALRAVYGEDSDAEHSLGTVSFAERRRRRLATGRLTAAGELLDLTDHAARIELGAPAGGPAGPV